MEKETYISIPLMKLLADFIGEVKNYNFISKALILNDNELKILMLLRSGKFDTMTVHFKKGNPFLVEQKQHIKIFKESRLSEIFFKRDYEKIDIISKDGNITFSHKTTKTFL